MRNSINRSCANSYWCQVKSLIVTSKKFALNTFVFYCFVKRRSLSRWACCHCVCLYSGKACVKVCLLLARLPSSGISPVCRSVFFDEYREKKEITWQSLLHLPMQINFILPPGSRFLLLCFTRKTDGFMSLCMGKKKHWRCNCKQWQQGKQLAWVCQIHKTHRLHRIFFIFSINQ